MALDSRIPLGAQVAQIPNPVETIGTLTKLRRQKADDDAALAERERKTKEDATLQGLYTQHQRPDGTPDFDAIVNAMSPLYPERAMKLRGEFNQHRIQAANAQRTEWQTETEQAAWVANQLKGATPETYPAILAQIQARDPEAAAALGPQFDPAKVDQLVTAAMSVTEYNNRKQKVIDDLLEGKHEQALGRSLSLAYDQESWDDALAMGRLYGMPEPVLDSYGKQFSPEAAKRAGLRTMTPEERDANDRADAAAVRADEAADRAERRLDADLDLRRRAENRLQSGADARARGDGENGTADTVSRRQAETWKANQLAELAKGKVGMSAAYGRETALTPEQVAAEEYRIENSYRSMIGQPPLPPFQPAAQPAPAPDAAAPSAPEPDEAPAGASPPGARSNWGMLPMALRAMRGSGPPRPASQTPKPAPSAPQTPKQQEAAKRGVVVGAIIHLKNNRGSVRVKAVHPDGRVETEPLTK